jgi:hypothetical protein
VGFVAVHVVATVSDGYVPITFVDAFLPFASPYRPVWVGLGALAFDLLLVVLVTSALRHRIGYASWRFVHWLAYLCWPIAMFHAAGSGSDASLPFTLALDASCLAAVLVAVAWRLVTGRQFSLGRRTAAAVAAVAVVAALGVFVALGPLRPGWSHRSGTSTDLLSQLGRDAVGTGSSTTVVTGSGGSTGSTGSGGSGAADAPTAPFTYNVSGTRSETSPDANGHAVVTIDLQVQDPGSTNLSVILDGTALRSGGVTLSSGTVVFGAAHGVVTSLDAGTVRASLNGSPSQILTLHLESDGTSTHLSGTITGTPGGTG